ncbi:hypothetical protein TREMEDRAFT_61267 [Tremella mesenterica DSM 1558]|uniref:uncharacterized protein n=1 Tax=Tremella mesenterica (strain ATCC 24925 / CBS 8224 / DSM 1558 / NBRC 9311 / NRRL Y-6157 / RJB 2259-6 / UBC 559-6) TaxID=578456 RepID=UPI0003F4903F|nr:uncharacterized protein TREMEDRAFT_61267 [Tremella mesenterica DSM 1558]EIW70760.1 hypothetical protein TREMEDRAFT_61267 [Tremella mesenterica DSM 1558]
MDAFDLLINAIRGPPYNTPEDPLDYLSTQPSHNADHNSHSAPSSQDIAKIIPVLSKLCLGHSDQDAQQDITRIEVWHPTTAQKSYVNERRMLSPAPLLRVSGPLLSTLTAVTLATVYLSPDTPPMSWETRIIPLDPSSQPPSPPASSHKRAEREARQRRWRSLAAKAGFAATLSREKLRMIARERKALEVGLAFPALWAGGKKGKGKQFQLRLTLGPPGQDVALMEPPADHPTEYDTHAVEEQRTGEDTLHDAAVTALGEMFGADDLEGLSALRDHDIENALRDHEIGNALGSLADHLPAAVATELAPSQSELTSTITHDQNGTPAAVLNANEQSNVGHQEEDPTLPYPPVLKTLNSVSVQTQTPTHDVWATLTSPPLDMVSKPSIKTAKSRSAAFLSTSTVFALWVRIHAQTVRTKYMSMETPSSNSSSGKLTAKTGKWTPFRFHVISLAPPPIPQAKRRQDSDTLTFGSVVQLHDVHTGSRSEPVRLVKVEKGEVDMSADEGRPISVLQRLGLVRVEENAGQRMYLSAPGARQGGAELMTPDEISRIRRRKVPNRYTQEGDTLADMELPLEGDIGSIDESSSRPRKKVKTKRNALARVVIEEDEEGSTLAEVSWAGVKVEERDGKIVDKVEDWMCWVIGGVSSFSYSFINFDPLSHSLDPIPNLLSDPQPNPTFTSLDLLLPSSAQHSHLYLGPLGPLSVSVLPPTTSSQHQPLTDPEVVITMRVEIPSSQAILLAIEEIERRLNGTGEEAGSTSHSNKTVENVETPLVGSNTQEGNTEEWTVPSNSIQPDLNYHQPSQMVTIQETENMIEDRNMELRKEEMTLDEFMLDPTLARSDGGHLRSMDRVDISRQPTQVFQEGQMVDSEVRNSSQSIESGENINQMVLPSMEVSDGQVFPDDTPSGEIRGIVKVYPPEHGSDDSDVNKSMAVETTNDDDGKLGATSKGSC